MPDRRAYEYRKNQYLEPQKDGREVTAYTLRNIRGMRVKISSLGAAIVSVEMKDFAGERKDIVLGYDKVSDYEENGTFFGAAVGLGGKPDRRRRICAGWDRVSPSAKMRERITCTVDRTVMRSASGIV